MNRRLLTALIILWMFLLPLSALSTDELVARMEANNLELKKARQDWQTALLDVKDAKAGRGPTVDMTVSGTYMYNPPVGPVYVSTQDLLQQLSEQNVDVSLLEGQPDAYLKLYGGMEHTLYTFSLNITQPVFTWGKITDSIELYQKAADVRSLQITALERKQKSELASRREAVFYLLQMQKLVKEERENASRLAEIAMSARDNGLLLDVDVLKVKIQVQQIDV
ncbi:MAG: TolC family protein, partial [Sphaerochaetaceae bacterium]